MVTIFKNIWDKENPHWISADQALDRIKSGVSIERISEIRTQLDKERSSELKKNLPCVCFSGKFSRRFDDCMLEHSKFIVLDFDQVDDLRNRQAEIISNDFIYACWLSPRGNGLKALVKIADGKKHRIHFQALKDVFPEIDDSGKNESRVCYESYDPEIYINRSAKVFSKTKEVEKITVTETVYDKNDVFQNLCRWLTNKGDAFKSGERNSFLFKLASACCRFGIAEVEAKSLIQNAFLVNSPSFSLKEANKAIESAYRQNRAKSGTANFEKEVLVDNVTRKEIEVDNSIYDESVRPKDVIFGEDVKADALLLYKNGYEDVSGVGVNELDEIFKFKKGEITLLSGIGNYGKSTFWHWLILMRVLKYDEKFAFFSPETFPAHLFYHDFVETLLGSECTPANHTRPNIGIYEAAYDFVSKKIFYVYPKDISPSPDYIKERFLELIIKEKISGVLIDPFNQMANDYGKAGNRSDKYLETFLSDCTRFAQLNNIFFSIIAHPKLMRKDADGNYPCPDVFDIADGAMWNNKMDNILVYHRPNHQADSNSPVCQLHSKKIRRQKSVGKKGVAEFEMVRKTRRFYFSGSDPLQKLINEKELDFLPKQMDLINALGPGKWVPVPTDHTESNKEILPF